MWGPLLTAMVTPFDSDGNLDRDAAGRLAVHLADSGSTGVLVCGTTGESPTLSHAEKLDLVKVVKDALDGRAKLLVGTGSNNTATTCELTREVTDLGVDGIMLVCPYYNKPSQPGLYQHFAAAAAATDLPVMLYNIEGRSARNIEVETVRQLAAEVDNIVALKEASGQINQFAQMALAVPNGFALYSGNDSDTPAILACGGVGVVSVASHIIGRALREMIEAFLTGDFPRGSRLYLQTYSFCNALFPAKSPNPVPVKEALNLRGIGVGGVRLPLVASPPEVVTALADRLHELEELGLI